MKNIFKFQNIAIVLTAGLIVFRLLSSTAGSSKASDTSGSYYDDGFVNYICLRPWEDDSTLSYWNINRHFDSFTELNYTAAHSWSGPSAYLGRFEDTVLSNMQLDTISSITQGCENNDLKLFLERIRLSYLCYAQRLVYEVGNSNSASNRDINYGFTFMNNMNNIKIDTGYGEIRTVQHADPRANNEGYLSSSIYENLQHTDLYYFSRGWYDTTNWYLKPVMRIKQADFSSTDTTKVVSIFVQNYLGNETDTFAIRVMDFGDLGGVNYSGNYLMNFNLPYITSGKMSDSTGLNFGRPGEGAGIDSCKVDFKIYWHGLVEVWLDKLIVDDEWANKLFSPLSSVNFDRRIRDEAEKLGGSMVFFVDEILSSNAYATKYVKDKLKIYNSDSKLMFAVSNNLNIHSHRNDETRSKKLFDIVKPDIVCLDDHVFQVDSAYKIYLPNNAEQYDPRIPSAWKVAAGTYNSRLQSHAFGSRNELSVPYQGTFVYQLTKIRDDLEQTSPSTKFFIQPHLHSWTKVVNNTFQEGFGFREPTNQEIQAQGMIAIAHGVESLTWLNYHSDSTSNINYSNPADTFFFNYGLRNSDHTKRTSNIIGQDKWNYVKAMNLKLLHWKPTLDSITWQSGYSVHNESVNHEYISDIRSIKRDPAPPHEFVIDDPIKYWEMGFFTPDKVSDRSKYFIMVNRRCVPDFNQTGDVRNLMIKFDSTQLAGFNNWTITELDSNHTEATFDRRSGSYIDFGLFQPGEGKLYKLASVMQEGGTLIADEDCGGFEFECKGEVINNGYDVSIKPQTTILFANSSARINMNGGSFYSGSSSESIPLYLKAKSGGKWRGLRLSNCEDAYLRNTVFENISPYPVDSTYAVELTDCGNVQVTNCTFDTSQTGRTGSLLLNYTSQGKPEDIYISSNTFGLNIGGMPSVSVISTGCDEVPMIMEWNDFQSTSESSTIAVLLSNVTGSAIKENNFSEYDRTVFMIGSTIDFYGNYIIGSNQSSIAIVQHSASNANLSASGEMFTGGYNSITAEGQTAKCIQLSNSYLLIDEGYNIFRLEDSQTNNYHLEGTIPNDVGADPYPAENNCFQLGNGLLVKHNLRWIDETAINLDTVPSSCNSERPESFMVFNLGNGINDTVRYESGGSGGGERAIRNYELGIKNYENSISENLKESVSNVEAVYIKALSDSVSISLRKRNYERVSALCREMLTDYADSINDASIISKLYLAELKQDTNQIRMSELKSFLESYILNNPQKEMMIRQAFYFIQKCKVSLGIYESAMSGFQQIINQFPYSYEGLLASWDYAATSLLNSQGGSGGGAMSKYDHELRDEVVISYIDDPNDVYDNRKFSTDDRKTLNENLTKTFSSQVNKQTREIKSLEEKLTKNEASNSEKKKYQEMRTLKEVVKARKPENVGTHISMISDDLNRIMKSTGTEYSDKYEANILPTEFALHQNYPNPFNPATKISFDLAQDSRVNLVVYDLLGREVAKLVNNEFIVAGTFIYDFNAASLSSGVYFYRLVVSSSNPLETVSKMFTKRMMLIK